MSVLLGSMIGQGNLGFTTIAGGLNGQAGKLGTPIQLLQVPGEVEDPEVVAVSLYALAPSLPASTPGPYVGIASWAAGNGTQNIAEFDVPLAANAQEGIGVSGGGVLLTLPLSNLTLMVRNDAGYIPAGSDRAVGGTLVGHQITGHVGVGSKANGAKVFRTVWAVNKTAGLAAAGTVSVGVPPFATKATVLRSDAANTISVSLIDLSGGTEFSGPYNVAANTPAPTLDLGGPVQGLFITNTGAGVIHKIAVLFELSI